MASLNKKKDGAKKHEKPMHPVLVRRTRSNKNGTENAPIILSDDDKNDDKNDKDKDSVDVVNRSFNTACQEEVDGGGAEKLPCEECGITKESILVLLDLLPPHLPPDLPFTEKSMDALELKMYLCGIRSHVLNPFSTVTRFSPIKERAKTQACNKCGIHQMYLSVLLDLSRSYLTTDDSLLGKIMGGNNDEGNAGNNTTEEESHAFMLRMIIGGIVEFLKHPGGTDDHASEDDDD